MSNDKIKKIYLIIFAIFVIFSTSFYFIAGEQLWYKESENNINVPEADGVSEEINKNTIVTQSLICNMDRIEKFAFIFTKNYQEGSGHLQINIKLDDVVIANQTFGVADDIPEQSRVYIELPKPIEEARDKTLTFTITSTSKEGEGVRAMICSTKEKSYFNFLTDIKKYIKEISTDETVNDNNVEVGENEKIDSQLDNENSTLIDGKQLLIDDDGNKYYIEKDSTDYNGTLCFSLEGSDTVPLGALYLPVFGGIGLVLCVFLFISYKNYSKGKNDYLTIAINAFYRYNFLINQLVERDFKTKYKRSVFGVLWSFLNPLLTMIVQFLVFSTIFKVDTQNYPVYLISGVVCFAFFSECSTMCLNSISGNYRLITKVYIPKYIFPLSKTLSSSVNLGVSLIPLLLVTLITGMSLHLSFILMFYFLICLIIFSLGIGMILATLMVFFRDIQFIWSVILTIWQYATPIFYPAEIIPDKFRFIVRLNPLYHFIGNARKCLIDGISPEPLAYLYCLIFALVALLIGSYIFKKSQDKFTLYL